MASNTDCIDPIYEQPLVPAPLPEDDCSGGGGGGGEGHKYTFRATATGWQVLEDGRVVYNYTDKNDNTTYTWQATTEGWLVKDNKGKVVFTYKDKDQDTTYSFEKKDDCGFKVTNSKGEVVFDYDNDCAGTTYKFEQDGVDFTVTDNKTNTVVFTYKGTVDTTYSFEDYKKGFKVTDSKGVVAYTYDPDFDPSDGSYPIDTLLTTVFKGHTTISTGQILGFTPADLVVGETLVYDGVGTLGVITKDNGDGTYQVTTMTTSPGSRQGVRLGSVEEETDLPATCAGAEAKGWQTPQLGDFAYVTTGGQGDEVKEYVITNVDDDCNLTWAFSHSFNAGDYQAQSTTGMSGMILTGGAVQGTFGTPIDPSTLIRGVLRNGILLVPDANGKVNVIVDDSHIIVNALPTTGIVDKAEYVVIDANQKVTGTWVHDATGWYQTYEPPKNVTAHQLVDALPTTSIEEGVEYIVVDAQNKVQGTWVYNPTKGWLQTERPEKAAHIVVKDLPTTGIDDTAEYIQVENLTDPINTYLASWVHTDSGWIKVSEAMTAVVAHIAVTALPTTNINTNAEYVVLTNLNDPATYQGTYVRVNGNWVQTDRLESGYHIVTALPTSNIDDKHDYIVVEDLTKPDETLIGHWAYDPATKKWLSLSSKYEVYRGLTMNGYAANAEDFQEVPVGSVSPFFGKTAPAHYLICDGTVYNVGTYPELEAFIYENYGKLDQWGGNGTSTWAVPDLRGEFLRGAGGTASLYRGAGAAVGVHQNPTLTPTTAGGSGVMVYSDTSDWNVAFDADFKETSGYASNVGGSGSGGHNTGRMTYRPTNTAVNWIIKADSTYSIVSNENQYAVATKAVYSVKSTQMIFPVLSNADGMTTMTDGQYFIAPVDGFYTATFMFPETAHRMNAYFGTYVYLNDTLIGGTRSQTGNGSNNTTANDTYALNSSFTLQLKKGDKVRVGLWVQLLAGNETQTYTETGRATFVLLQGASSQTSTAEMMMKPNLWPVNVEQNFGDGVYGYRYKQKVNVKAGRTDYDILTNTPATLKVLSYGGSVDRNFVAGSNYSLFPIPATWVGTQDVHMMYEPIINRQDKKMYVCTWDTHTGQVEIDMWILYTK